MGVKVTDTIITYSENDTYPTHLDNLGKGGVHSVSTIEDRDAISEERRSEGMLCYVIDDASSLYILNGGITNDKWKLIADFDDIPTFDGNIVCKKDYILKGADDDLTEQSPSWLDLKQDFIDLRRVIEELKAYELTIQTNYVAMGGSNNKLVGRAKILKENLPNLGAALFPVPFDIISVPLPNPTFNYLNFKDYVMSGAWLPQVYAGKADSIDPLDPFSIAEPANERLEISSTLAMTQIQVMQALKRIENSSFVVKTRDASWTWENIKIGLLPTVVKDYYSLNSVYNYKENDEAAAPLVQALDELKEGFLYNTEGILSRATLAENYILVGTADGEEPNIEYVPKPKTLAEAGIANTGMSFLLRNRTNAEGYDEAQALSEVEEAGFLEEFTTHMLCFGSDNKLYKAKGGATVGVDDYVTPFVFDEYKIETDTELLGIQAELAAIQVELLALDAALVTLETVTVAGIAADLVATTAAVAILNSDVSVLETNVSGLQIDFTNLGIRVTANETDIGELDIRVTALEDGGGGGGGGGTLERIINILNHIDIDVDYHPDSLMSNIDATSDLVRVRLKDGRPRFIIQGDNAELILENKNYSGFSFKLGYEAGENNIKLFYKDEIGTFTEVVNFGQESGLNIEKGILNTVTSNPKSIVNKEFAQALITQQLQNISNLSTIGIVVRDGANSFITRNLVEGTGISISNISAIDGNPTINVSNIPINTLSGYPNNSSVFLKGDGTWGATPTVPTKSVLQAYVTDTYATNTAINDYIKYNGFHFGTGSNISLDNYSAYTTALNTNGLGRITLVGNKAYKITTKLLLYNYIQNSKRFCWFDVDAGIELFLGVFINPVSASFSEAYHCFYYQTNQNKRIALKILSSVNNLQICGRNFPSYGLDMGSTSVIVEEV